MSNTVALGEHITAERCSDTEVLLTGGFDDVLASLIRIRNDGVLVPLPSQIFDLPNGQVQVFVTLHRVAEEAKPVNHRRLISWRTIGRVASAMLGIAMVLALMGAVIFAAVWVVTYLASIIMEIIGTVLFIGLLGGGAWLATRPSKSSPVTQLAHEDPQDHPETSTKFTEPPVCTGLIEGSETRLGFFAWLAQPGAPDKADSVDHPEDRQLSPEVPTHAERWAAWLEENEHRQTYGTFGTRVGKWSKVCAVGAAIEMDGGDPTSDGAMHAAFEMARREGYSDNFLKKIMDGNDNAGLSFKQLAKKIRRHG